MAHKGGKTLRANWEHRYEERRKEAEVRQAAYAELTSKQKLERLDQRFGPDNGARRERKKIRAAMRKGAA